MNKLFLLFLPVFILLPFCVAGLVYLTPAHFEPAEPLASGRSYIVNFYLSNKDDREVAIQATMECFPEPDRVCAPADWYSFPENFTLGSRGSKQVQVEINIPKNQQDGLYQNALLISSDNPSVSGQTKLAVSLAGIIRFEKQGDLNWLQRMYYSLRQRFQKGHLASVGEYGLTNILLYLFAGIGALLILIKIYSFLFRKFKRKNLTKP